MSTSLTPLLVSTAIPYVNAAPHLGHVLELVQADVLARHARAAGRPVRAVSGTDDNSLKNVLAARAAGVSTSALVAANSAKFASLHEPLELVFDEFTRTSVDPRHHAVVERLWRACAAAGDLYRKTYTGHYCVGCEAFYNPAELPNGRCPEHLLAPEEVAEDNWFFRLSAYTEPLLAALESDRPRVLPAARRNEVLAFVRGGLGDLSVSRPANRARGWGIPVPDDPDQVVYVWFDALAYYLTAGTAGGQDWWSTAYRQHLIGKGILRFHAVYWPAILLSAGLPLPDEVLVHDYLTVDGAKIAKSGPASADPLTLVERYGSDAVRWWLTSEVPKLGDVDFTEARLIHRHDTDLAGGLGNLINRTAALSQRNIDHLGAVGDIDDFAADTLGVTGEKINSALAEYDFRAATDAIRAAVAQGNRYVERTRPWACDQPERALRTLTALGNGLADQVEPFLPAGTARLRARLAGSANPPFRRLHSR
ncbi:MAG TPA: methionine--tRNA ligase [Pseudonocardiaceae bacterium]|jgi:methionyl-tRNA synthetase|nr:methionine--tRNA ligase [Pseudonocardiaceae bacterium]